jgi:hypothetical protein
MRQKRFGDFVDIFSIGQAGIHRSDIPADDGDVDAFKTAAQKKNGILAEMSNRTGGGPTASSSHTIRHTRATFIEMAQTVSCLKD